MEEITGLKPFSKFSDTLRADMVVTHYVVLVTAELTFSVTIAVLFLTGTHFSCAHHLLVVDRSGPARSRELGLRSVLGLRPFLGLRSPLRLSFVLRSEL